MTVQTRLVATFGVLTVLLLVPALFAASRLADLRDLAVEGRRNHAAVAQLLGRVATTAADLDAFQRSYVGRPDTALAREVRRARARLTAQLDSVRQSRYGSATSAIEPTLASIRVKSRQIDSLVAAGRLGAATDSVLGMQPLFARMDEGLDALADSVDLIAGRDFEQARSISQAARTGTLLGLVAALLIALLLGAWTTEALTRPLHELVDAAGAVREGRLEAPEDLPYEREDEIGELSRAFRAMAHRLAELDRLKAEFVGVASHELKTPINVIRGYTELIEENIAGEVTEQQAEILGAIAEQTRVMSRLVSRLMDISRLETGTYRMEIEEVHTEDLLTGLLRSFDILANEKDIELDAEIEPSAPEVVRVDVDLVRDEILGNVLSNAVKYTPPGGRVSIRVWGEGGNVGFEVSDTGPGIPPEDREHIFEKYYQVHRSRKVGTGLGLAVAREMVEAHGGRIELHPHASSGATFRVFLPVEGTEAREPQIQGGARSEAPEGAVRGASRA